MLLNLEKQNIANRQLEKFHDTQLKHKTIINFYRGEASLRKH